MLHIFLNCGLRLSEIKNLNIEDINLNDDKFTIIGKGNKERTKFLTDYGFRMSVTTIKKIVKRAYGKFDTNNIHSVELNLLDGQVEIILRALELYGYNLDYMLNSNDSSDDTRQEKLALLKYTYEQVLATQAEQIESKSNNTENIPEFGKILIKDGIKNNEIDFKLNVG